MKDPLIEAVEELGEEALGLRWLAVRRLVLRWIENNPERVRWLCRRVRRLVREGRI
jgi:hypothetical protein